MNEKEEIDHHYIVHIIRTECTSGQIKYTNIVDDNVLDKILRLVQNTILVHNTRQNRKIK